MAHGHSAERSLEGYRTLKCKCHRGYRAKQTSYGQFSQSGVGALASGGISNGRKKGERAILASLADDIGYTECTDLLGMAQIASNCRLSVQPAPMTASSHPSGHCSFPHRAPGGPLDRRHSCRLVLIPLRVLVVSSSRMAPQYLRPTGLMPTPSSISAGGPAPHTASAFGHILPPDSTGQATLSLAAYDLFQDHLSAPVAGVVRRSMSLPGSCDLR